MQLLLTSLPLADIPPNVLMIALGGMGIGVLMAIGGLYFQNRRRELWHETARLALEKGQPLPPLSEDMTPQRPAPADEGRIDLRAGLICVATGIGLYIFLGELVSRQLGYVGAIPGFIGVALLLNALISGWLSRKNPSSSSRPPQS